MCASEEGGIIERTLWDTRVHLETTGVGGKKIQERPLEYWKPLGSQGILREALELLQGIEWGL